MSDTLFGGSDSLSAIQSNLQDVMKKLDGLTGVVKARNPTKQDAIMMQGDCPSGLVGCHPAKLNEASGGLLNCPTAEHLPDPIIVDSVGRFCYAPKAVREVLDGKDLNIQSLQKKYSEKILEMLKDGQNLAVAVQSLTSTAPNSSYIINIFSNNNFVRVFAEGTIEGKDRMAAVLTRYSNALNAYTGGSFVARILQEEEVTRNPTGIFDEDEYLAPPATPATGSRTFRSPLVRRAGAAVASRFGRVEPGPRGLALTAAERDARIAERAARRDLLRRDDLRGEAAAGFPPVIELSGDDEEDAGVIASLRRGALAAARSVGLAGGQLEGGRLTVHLRIAEVLLASMILTHPDASKKAETVKLIDALGLVFDFDGKNLGVLPKDAIPTSTSIAKNALQFLPNPLKRDLFRLAQTEEGIPVSQDDSRAQMEVFILMSFQLVFIELYTKKDAKYVPALLVMQNAYKTMRDKEVEAKSLQEKRRRGEEITTSSVEEVVRVQKAARRDYVLSCRTFNQVTIEIYNYTGTVMPDRDSSSVPPSLKNVAIDVLEALMSKNYYTTEFDTFVVGLESNPSLVPSERDRSDVFYDKVDFGLPAAASIAPSVVLKAATAQRRADAGFRGGDFEPIDGGELDDAFMGLVGGAVPQHFMPKEILDVGKDYEGVVDDNLKKKFKALGYGEIPVFYSKKCPVYATDNNTVGPNRTWIATKHPWAKCQELLGYQMVSEEGYCYPQGAYCYPEDDVVTVTKKTVQAVDAWLSTAKLYNSIMKKKYDSFFEAEVARIKAQQPAYGGLTQKEIEQLAIDHMPSELQPLSEYAATTSLVLTSNSFNDAVSQITNSSDAKQREEIRKILFETYSYAEEWVDDDKVAEQNKLDQSATRLADVAKDCTEASLVAVDKVPKELLPTAMALPGVDVVGVNLTGEDADKWSKSADKCEAVKIGDKPHDLVLIPKEINARFDAKKAEKGEANDPVVAWWRMYYGAKAEEQAKKLRNVTKHISPFETDVGKPHLADVKHRRAPTAQEYFDKSLDIALPK